MSNQTITNATVVVDSVTVPEGGFVVVHGSGYVFDDRPAPLGASDYLAAGTHENVSVELRGERAEQVISNDTLGRVAAVVHRDNGDRTLSPLGGVDQPYRVGGERVEDTATIRDPHATERAELPPASETVTTTSTAARTRTTSPPVVSTTTATVGPTTSAGTSGGSGFSALDTAGFIVGGVFTIAAVAVVTVVVFRGGSHR